MQRADELVAEDLEHVGAHQPADDAHRDQRQGDDRQDQMPRLLPAGRKPATAHALRRQDVEDHGENRDEDDADPVMRQAYPGDRRRRKRLVEPGAAIERGERAEHHPEAETEQRRGQGQHQGIAEGVEQLVRYRPIGKERYPKIADQQPPEPCEILDIDRLVEGKAGAQRVGNLLRHLGRHQQVDDIARSQMDQREHQHRHAEQDRHGVKQTADDIGPHGGLPVGGCGSPAAMPARGSHAGVLLNHLRATPCKPG